MRLDSLNIATPQHPLAPRTESRPPRQQDPLPAVQINQPSRQMLTFASDRPVTAAGRSAAEQEPEAGNAAPRNSDGRRGRVLDLVA